MPPSYDAGGSRSSLYYARLSSAASPQPRPGALPLDLPGPKITVRRGTAVANRPIAEPAAADVDALRREFRRLRAEVLGLQEEKQDLERRNARAGADAGEDPAGHLDLVDRPHAAPTSERPDPRGTHRRGA